LSSIRELLFQGRRLLRHLPHTDPGLESRLLLQKAAGLAELDVLLALERPVPANAERRFFKLVEERRARVPLAYLTGEKEFWSIPFKVFPGVLIPRPETELLVEKVIELSSKKREWIADIGTGSGNIAVSLAKELPKARIIAADISRRALKAARFNAERQKVASIAFVEGNLFRGLLNVVPQRSVDFIVSNPPYVSAREWRTLEPEIRLFEPKRALVPGPTGFEFIRRLVRGAPDFLRSGGHLLFEVGQGQASRVLSLFDSRWTDVEIIKDLVGIPRLVAARKF